MLPLVIAMLSESYLPRISGVTHSIASYTRALRADGHRVLVLAPRYREFTDQDPDVIRLPSIALPGYADFPFALPWHGRLARELWARRVDLLHVHSPFIAGRLGMRLARHLQRPLVFTHHTLYHEYVHYIPWVPRSVARRVVLRHVTRFANRCDLVIAPSAMVRDFLRGNGVAARIEVLPTGGIDPSQFAVLDGSAVRPRYGIPGGTPLLVTVSRLATEKSVDLVLRAFQQVTAAREAYLLIVGGGPSEASLRRLAGDLGLDQRARFTGGLPHSAALEAMAAADLFVFASQTETMGLVLVEAMAAGTPIVAVARGGAPEVLRHGETGRIVQPEAGELAEEIRVLLDHPERRAAMAQRAKVAAQQYTISVLAGRLAALYAEVVRQTGARQAPGETKERIQDPHRT